MMQSFDTDISFIISLETEVEIDDPGAANAFDQITIFVNNPSIV